MKLLTGTALKKELKNQLAFNTLTEKLKGSRTALVYTVLVGMVLIATGLLVPFYTKVFIDYILLGSSKNWLTPLLAGMAATVVVKGSLMWFKEHYLFMIERQIALKSSSDFFRKLLHLPPEFFFKRYTGDIAKRIHANEKLAEFLSRELTHSVINVVMAVFYLILMLQYDVVLSLIGAAAAGVNFLILKRVHAKRAIMTKEMLEDKAEYSGIVVSGLRNIETIKASGLEADYLNLKTGFQSRTFDSEGKFVIFEQYLHHVPTFLTNFTNIVVLLMGCHKILDGQMTMGVLVAFQSLMAGFLEPVNSLAALNGKFIEFEGELHHVNDVLEYGEEQGYSAHGNKPGGEFSGEIKGDIELKNLYFSYAENEKTALENLNIKIKAGSRIVVIGGTGSGKSTLARVLGGLYRPASGQVLLDGTDFRNFPREVLAKAVKIVDRDTFLFEGSVRDNITLWDKDIPEWDIVRCTRDVLLHDDISAREGGYGHMLLEGGANFSVGQRQRLEIARVLVHNPSIIILDEALDVLDPLTREVVERNINERGCTVISIAQSLSNVNYYDKVIFMEDGRIKKIEASGANEIVKEQKV